MSFIPVIVMNVILLVITVLLAVADRLLVTYGECTITVAQEEEKREFKVQGGNTLLADLTEHKFNISSSCGGKATCGYCKVKVVRGGGPLLPTEEIFMSREEKLDSIRLACQVKVKNDLEIYIPDFLTTVRDIVKNRTYDPRRRSNFAIAQQAYDMPEEPTISTKLDAKEKVEIDTIIQKYKDDKGALILILQSVNVLYTYFPEHILWYISQETKIPLSYIFRVGTFYNAFSLKPRGRNVIRVCLGTSCYVKGGKKILESLENKLGIKVGQSTKDLRVSLETVNCIGCCGQSPVISINDEIHGYIKQSTADSIVDNFMKGIDHGKIKTRRS